MFVQPVPGHDDLIAFKYDFVLDGKALADGTAAQTVTELDDGDLLIEGYAAVWEGEDREGENFAPGAFERGIKSFLKSQAALCFHHKHDHVLGKVLELEEEEGKGLRMKARVDGAIKDHPTLKTYYQQIKNGTLNGLSVGGFFKRAIIEGKKRIADMDFTEISVTGVPVHTGPSFAVVAGKALVSDVVVPDNVTVNLPDGAEEIREDDLMWLNDSLSSIERIIERINNRSTSNTATTA